MIRCKSFGGLFIMKRFNNGWQYLSKYSARKGSYKFEWSTDTVRYFPDSSIESELAWKVFAEIRKESPENGLVLYAMINGKPVRVKYYNPNGDPKTISWYAPSDFYAYLPKKIFY